MLGTDYGHLEHADRVNQRTDIIYAYKEQNQHCNWAVSQTQSFFKKLRLSFIENVNFSSFTSSHQLYFSLYWFFFACGPHCCLEQNPLTAEKVVAEIPLALSAHSLISFSASFCPQVKFLFLTSAHTAQHSKLLHKSNIVFKQPKFQVKFLLHLSA